MNFLSNLRLRFGCGMALGGGRDVRRLFLFESPELGRRCLAESASFLPSCLPSCLPFGKLRGSGRIRQLFATWGVARLLFPGSVAVAGSSRFSLARALLVGILVSGLFLSRYFRSPDFFCWIRVCAACRLQERFPRVALRASWLRR